MRYVGLVICLALLAPSLMVAQAQSTPAPRDPVVAYQEVIVLPMLYGRTPKDEELARFYRTYVSIHSQVKVAEDQFIAFWKQAAERSGMAGARFLSLIVSGTTYTIAYKVGEPVYNEAGDQALLEVVVTVTTQRLFSSRQESAVAILGVIKESGLWKVILADDLVKEAQKLPTARTAIRYAVMRNVTVKGITLSVAALAIEKDMTVLDVTVANAGETPLDLVGAISAATLLDDTGASYASRTLRSTLATTVPPKQSVKGTLAFYSIAPVTERVTLRFPDVQMGDESVSLVLEMRLR